MGDANENPGQQEEGLPPRHCIIPDAVAAARASRPVRLASQAQLLGGCGGLANQKPPAHMRMPSRNTWSRTVPSLLPSGKSYRIIDTSFSSVEAPVPAPPPLLVSAPSPRPISDAFAWPVPSRGWTLSLATGRHRYVSGGGASSSSAAPRAPTAPPAPRAPAPPLPAPPAPAAPPAQRAPAPRLPALPAPPAPAFPLPAPPAPLAPPSRLQVGPVMVRPPTGPARARLAPAAPEEAFEEYLVERRVIDAPVDAVPWRVIGGSEEAGVFVMAGPGRDRAALEAAEARERRKNMMDKRKAAAAARARQPPPPPADVPESSGCKKNKRGAGRKKKQA